MGEFFKSRRRKLGVGTLLIALGFMAGWMRSQSVYDIIDFVPIYVDDHTYDTFISCYWGIGWRRTQSPFIRLPAEVRQMSWESDSDPNAFPSDMAKRAPFGFRSDFEENGVVYLAYFIPYSSFAVPLTLLSAYLLISRPRSAKPATSTTTPDSPSL
jgi:hypothetical protein